MNRMPVRSLLAAAAMVMLGTTAQAAGARNGAASDTAKSVHSPATLDATGACNTDFGPLRPVGAAACAAALLKDGQAVTGVVRQLNKPYRIHFGW